MQAAQYECGPHDKYANCTKKRPGGSRLNNMGAGDTASSSFSQTMAAPDLSLGRHACGSPRHLKSNGFGARRDGWTAFGKRPAGDRRTAGLGACGERADARNFGESLGEKADFGPLATPGRAVEGPSNRVVTSSIFRCWRLFVKFYVCRRLD